MQSPLLVFFPASVVAAAQSAAGQEPPSGYDPLSAHGWRLVAFAEPGAEVAPGHEAILEFDPSQPAVAGFAGCNRFSAAYEHAGRGLELGRVRTTMMACPDEPRTRQEAAFLEALEAVAGYEIVEGALGRLDAEEAPLLRFVRRAEG